MRNSSDTVGNRTRNLLACSAVSQPTAPPCAPSRYLIQYLIHPISTPPNKTMHYTTQYFNFGDPSKCSSVSCGRYSVQMCYSVTCLHDHSHRSFASSLKITRRKRNCHRQLHSGSDLQIQLFLDDLYFCYAFGSPFQVGETRAKRRRLFFFRSQGKISPSFRYSAW